MSAAAAITHSGMSTEKNTDRFALLSVPNDSKQLQKSPLPKAGL